MTPRITRTPGAPRKLTPEDELLMVADFNNPKLSVTAVALKWDLARKTVYEIAERHGAHVKGAESGEGGMAADTDTSPGQQSVAQSDCTPQRRATDKRSA